MELKLNEKQEHIKQKTIQIETFQKEITDKNEELASLKQYIQKKEDQIVKLNNQLLIEKQSQNLHLNEQDQLKEQVFSLKEQITKLTGNISGLKGKEGIFKQNVDKLEKGEVEIMKNLKCQYCLKFIKEPVTIIPCGHSFCQQCKTAYNKSCIKCGPKVKIEAMYRNELLDDIIELVKIISGAKEALQSLIKMK
ncbi:lim domain protein [Ichthyophthirius multifiliis]|uniref:Lim domain protein n=1 Tax=Ichthyophthirius multifiliis TaxID=5932 RepID=G0QZI0_ICHMU|nr:lim domain protein [Ichthyophthirius multifiliis]EGR29369.1 lim domain protein [Ichthyophthirius multifiliis]|eukprot:XP_004030605.1 lim domain protein [Ichthyophthirius multifiliis]